MQRLQMGSPRITARPASTAALSHRGSLCHVHCKTQPACDKQAALEGPCLLLSRAGRAPYPDGPEHRGVVAGKPALRGKRREQESGRTATPKPCLPGAPDPEPEARPFYSSNPKRSSSDPRLATPASRGPWHCRCAHRTWSIRSVPCCKWRTTAPSLSHSYSVQCRHTLTFICSHMRIARARYGQYSSPYAARQLW